MRNEKCLIHANQDIHFFMSADTSNTTFISSLTLYLFQPNSDWSKLKEFLDGKYNLVQKMILLCKDRVEKGENVGFQHFLLFPLQKPSS